MRALVKIGALGMIALPTMAGAQVYVQGHVNRDGTYTQPHMRTAPDGNPYNNWSSSPNVNPHTGRQGTVDPNTIPRSTYPTVPQYRPYTSPLPPLRQYNNTGRRIF